MVSIGFTDHVCRGGYLGEKKASGEALAVDMGIPISLAWEVMLTISSEE